MINVKNTIKNFDTFKGIIADSREPLEKFADIILDFEEHAKSKEELPHIEIHALPYADYLICTKNNRLLIERKEVHDYCNSLKKNLEERFNNMRIENELTMLLIEGNPDLMNQNVVSRWNYQKNEYSKAADFRTFKNFPLQQQLNGSMFTQTRDYKDTVFTLISYYHYLNELPAIEKKCVYKPWERWFALAPFVGKRKINKLIEKYDNCYDAIMKVDEWATENIIEGIKSSWKASN